MGFLKFRIPKQRIRNPVRNTIPGKCSGIRNFRNRNRNSAQACSEGPNVSQEFCNSFGSYLSLILWNHEPNVLGWDDRVRVSGDSVSVLRVSVRLYFAKNGYLSAKQTRRSPFSAVSPTSTETRNLVREWLQILIFKKQKGIPKNKYYGIKIRVQKVTLFFRER